MVAFPRLQGLSHAIPPAGAALCGAATVAFFTLTPAEPLANMVWNSGIAAVLPAAEPPLGVTARAVLALGGGVIAAAVGWSALYLLFGPGGFLAPRRRKERGALVLRRADAHPDTPPRPPMTAADLGTPMMEVAAAPAEAPLPRDLDLPLAAFDPGAIPMTPREPVRPVPPLAPTLAEPEPAVDVAPQPEPEPQPDPVPTAPPALAEGERIETFELTPMVRPVPRAAPAAPAAPSSIETLLRRLEAGASRRVAQG